MTTDTWTTIPGFTKYEINTQGIVRRKSNHTLIDCYEDCYHINADKGLRMSVEKQHLLDATFFPNQLIGVTPLFLSIVQLKK